MKNGIFLLYKRDYVKGAITAIGAAVFITFYNITIVNGFDLFAVDYVALLHNIINVSWAAFIGYLAKNFFSTDKGSLLNVTPDLNTPKQ